MDEKFGHDSASSMENNQLDTQKRYGSSSVVVSQGAESASPDQKHPSDQHMRSSEQAPE